MKNMYRYLALVGISLRASLTPEERKILNQFLRGNNNLED